jgi:hypothetical protein
MLTRIDFPTARGLGIPAFVANFPRLGIGAQDDGVTSKHTEISADEAASARPELKNGKKGCGRVH